VLDSNTPSTIFSRVSSLGTVLSLASPSPRFTTDMATATAFGVRFDSCSVTVLTKFVTCLTISGATAGLSGRGLTFAAGCAGRGPPGAPACPGTCVPGRTKPLAAFGAWPGAGPGLAAPCWATPPAGCPAVPCKGLDI
jgi:hypothetical protein